VAHVPMDKVILKKWLKAGFMEKHALYRTDEGTPQGGIMAAATDRPIVSYSIRPATCKSIAEEQRLPNRLARAGVGRLEPGADERRTPGS